MTHPDPTAMRRFLDSVEYPCDRVQLVRDAASRGADDDVIGHLCTLPDETFDNADSAEKALGTSG